MHVGIGCFKHVKIKFKKLYADFRDIVTASHLKPLEKKDNIGSVFKQPWNLHATKTDEIKTENTVKAENVRI